MSENKGKKGRHLTIVERMFIEEALFQHMPLKEIAKQLEKDPTTISKEIKRNRIEARSRVGKDFVICQHYKGCKKMHLCSESCSHMCYRCKITNCYRICPDYRPRDCVTTKRFPYVCNGCGNESTCYLGRYHYKARVANANYTETLSKSREGADITQKELEHLDQLISPLILRGQSITHIYENHKDQISCTQRTLYNYFEKQMFTAKNIDLPRKVKYKKRKKHKEPVLKDQKYKKGRCYEDFLAFTQEHIDTPVVEMDTVHGRHDGKVLLTLLFRNCSFMLSFIMDSCTQTCVKEKIDFLYEALGQDAFKELFPLILTDNGSEFKRPDEIEFDNDGLLRTKVFFCDPQASYQKARLEKNHEYIRYIIPKGKSFNELVQSDVTLMLNHINSTARASLNGSNPYQLAKLILNNVLLEKLSLKLIPADEVLLKPALLKK
jgi:IS30 family transposase